MIMTFKIQYQSGYKISFFIFHIVLQEAQRFINALRVLTLSWLNVITYFHLPNALNHVNAEVRYIFFFF